MEKPPTRKDDIREVINGIEIRDLYRWLENGEDPEVKKWSDTQNEYTFSHLKDGTFDKYSKELEEYFKVVNFSNPMPVKGRYFYTERQPDEDQFVLYVKEGLNGEPRKLVDPNGRKADNTVTIDYWVPSSSGKYVAYGISEGGNEMATLYVMDIDTGENLSYVIPHCRYAKVLWLPDDSGFFYTRNPWPGTVPKDEEHLHPKVYFHKLGENPIGDELIFGKDRPKDDMLGMALSLDGRYLAIGAGRTWTENDMYIYDASVKALTPLCVGIEAKFQVLFTSEKILLYTNHKANNYRVVWATLNDLTRPFDEWEECISERESKLEDVRITKDKILAEYLVNASSEVSVFDHNGSHVGLLPLPKYSSLAGISGRPNESEFFYGVDSFTFPKITYRFDPETNEYNVFRATDNPINPDEYNVRQEWCASADGTKVPLFIVHKKGIKKDGKNPLELTGYGGFGNSMTPSFMMRSWAPWCERGGIIAIANIRGGGEFGEDWHKGGIKENKQKSFDDFIAAAEHLIKEGYASAEHLGILGGSNGGLLVAAVAVQRPDLFKAVCSRVPLTDMIRFPKSGIAVRWIHQYGNPDIKEDLERILKWSPYHNVKEGVEYPAFLFTTGEKDTRVDPLHARKMAALLQNSNKRNRVLIFTEKEAGHGPGKPISKIVENQALTLTFLTQELF